MEYWWVSVIIVIIALLMIACAWLLRKNRRTNMIVLFVISLVLLIFKSVQFGIERSLHHYPIEFSHLSYFILGAIGTVGIKKLRPFAGICAFLSGLGFIVAGVFSPAPIIRDAESAFNWVTGILQHEVLFLAGLMIILNIEKYNIKDIWIPIVGIVIMFVFSLLVYYRVLYPDLAEKNHDDMVIIYLMFGTILQYLMPSGTVIPIWLRVGTLIVEFILLGAILWAFYFVNNKVYDKKLKKYPHYEEDMREYHLIALVKYIIKKRNDKKALPQQSPSDETPKQD